MSLSPMECHGNFFPRKSMEFHGGISYGMIPSYLKGLCHAIFYLFKKLKRVFEAIEFQEKGYI